MKTGISFIGILAAVVAGVYDTVAKINIRVNTGANYVGVSGMGWTCEGQAHKKELTDTTAKITADVGYAVVVDAATGEKAKS